MHVCSDSFPRWLAAASGILLAGLIAACYVPDTASGQQPLPGGATAGKGIDSRSAVVGLLKRFDPPGFLDDLSEPLREAWSKRLSAEFDKACTGEGTIKQGLQYAAPRSQFYNPMVTPTAADVVTKDITWTAFPRKSSAEPIPYAKVDADRFLQDEYCEWQVLRDPAGKIVRVTFTCEPWDYWDWMAANDPDKVVTLYQKFVNPKVQKSDLFDPLKNNYKLGNQWNARSPQFGIMHLIYSPNSLYAELDLVAGATIVRVLNNKVITDPQALAKIGGFGDPERHSDPTIGGAVNALARQKADVTITNPTGLYFGRLNTAGWEAPGGQDPRQFWKIVRGAPGYGVRAIYEVPPGLNFTVSDIKINGVPIQYGGQIAQHLTMKVAGQACRFGQSKVVPMTNAVQKLGGQPFQLSNPLKDTPKYFHRW